jgi:hypothetical protein
VGGGVRAMTITVRTDTDPLGLVHSVRQLIQETDPNLPITEMRSIEAVVADSVSRTSFTMSLLLLAAGISAFAGAREAIDQALEFVVYAWSVVYLFIAERRVYRASTLKIVLGLLALAASYTIFYALGVSVASMYAFLRI